jgi:predicted Zn-dependent protease
MPFASRAVRTVLLLTIGLSFIGAGGCATDRQVISQATTIHQGLEPAVMDDPTLNRYINAVGQRIVDVADELDKQGFGPASHKKSEDTSWMFKDMQFHFVNSKTLNAFTTGGKHMYIYNELFQTVKNEDELAAVMAHEDAHVYARHVAKAMDRQYAMLGLAAGAGIAGAAAGYQADDKQGALTYGSAAAGAALLAGQFLGMGFTRDDENEADKLGFQFYVRAGYDPEKFAGFFQTLIDKGLDKTPEALSDHPKLSNRVANTEKRIRDLPPNADEWRRPPIASPSEFRDLQARAARLGRTMPNDQSLQQAQLMLASFSSCVSPDEQPDQKRAQAIIAKAVQERQRRR